MLVSLQTVRLSGKQPKPTGNPQCRRGGARGSMGQTTKLPYASCPLHRLKVLFLLLNLHVTVQEGKQKHNVYTVFSSFIQICIYELPWVPITKSWGSKQWTKAGSQGLWGPIAQFRHFQRSSLLVIWVFIFQYPKAISGVYDWKSNKAPKRVQRNYAHKHTPEMALRMGFTPYLRCSHCRFAKQPTGRDAPPGADIDICWTFLYFLLQ